MENNNHIKQSREEKRNGYFTVAAVVSALLFAIFGLVPALWVGVARHKQAPDNDRRMSRMLLVDAAGSLRGALSAMRLCNEPETAESVGKTALVYVVRAETALECEEDGYESSRDKEEFLNDVYAVLTAPDPMEAAYRAELMYEYSVKFYDHVTNGADFGYNGELAAKPTTLPAPPPEPTENDISASAYFVKRILDADSAQHIGGWDGKIEYEVTRDSVSGYALTDGKRIAEFSFSHDGQTQNGEVDTDKAVETALDCAAACGYPNMEAYNIEVNGNAAIVMLCKNIDGAKCSGECATVTVVNGAAQSFRSGDCDCDHDVPSVKVEESKARSAAPKASGEGVLVTYNDGKRDRVCYEYRYELDDGVHYVYVCAENGKQAKVK